MKTPNTVKPRTTIRTRLANAPAILRALLLLALAQVATAPSAFAAGGGTELENVVGGLAGTFLAIVTGEVAFIIGISIVAVLVITAFIKGRQGEGIGKILGFIAAILVAINIDAIMRSFMTPGAGM